jgi:hypothetical protein
MNGKSVADEAAVERLQSSALVWPSFDQSGVNHERLEEIADAVEVALAYFPSHEWEPSSLPSRGALASQGIDAGDDEFPMPYTNTAQGPGAFWLQWEARFSPQVQQWAKRTFFDLLTSSRSPFYGGDPPSRALLAEKGFYSPPSPLRDEHLAVMAALVCIARALAAFDDVLSAWRDLALKATPKLRFAGEDQLAEWEDAIYTARCDDWMRTYEPKRLGEASTEFAKAQGWLGCAEQTVSSEMNTSRAVRVALATETSDRKVKQSKTNTPNAKIPRKAKGLHGKKLLRYFEKNASQKIEVTAGEIAKKAGVSTRTIFRRLEDAKASQSVEKPTQTTTNKSKRGPKID